MPKTTSTDILEYIDEFGERFGDQLNFNIIEAAEEFAERTFNHYEQIVLIVCYDHGIERARKEAKIWGVF